MERVVLYRKYRSRRFEDVVGQNHITSILKASLKNHRLSHAYLFVGPRGVGKTSVARIMAFAINDRKYDDEGHIDIIEIDAASNRRIDEIRNLRDKIHISPIELKYKVYIIDEVHMLTREAFNALLKTLEEPPRHAIFILATTELHKVPPTIISRTQQFIFRPILGSEMVKHLRYIADKESIRVDDDALELIAKQSKGSFRDSISLLDQISALDKQITVAIVQEITGYGDSSAVSALINHLQRGRVKELHESLDALYQKGAQATSLATQLIDVLKEEQPTSLELKCIDDLLTIDQSSLPHVSLEVALLRAAILNTPTKPQRSKNDDVIIPTIAESSRPAKLQEAPPQTESLSTKNRAQEKPTTKFTRKETEKKRPSAVRSSDRAIDSQAWKAILDATKDKSYPLYTILRMAQASLDDKKLTLAFNFEFHAKRLNEDLYKRVFQSIVTESLGSDVVFETIIQENIQPSSAQVDKLSIVPRDSRSSSTDYSYVLDTFGGGEVMEL